MMRISPFVKNVDRLDDHLKQLNLYLTAKSQTGTLDNDDVDALKEFVNIVGKNFNFNCKNESWWSENLFTTISEDVVVLIESIRDNCKGIDEDTIKCKADKIEALIDAMDKDISIELKSAIKESYPSLMILFPASKIAC